MGAVGWVVIIKLRANLSSTGTGIPTGTELVNKELSIKGGTPPNHPLNGEKQAGAKLASAAQAGIGLYRALSIFCRLGLVELVDWIY